MQKWNIPTNRAQRVDKKMGSFVYLSCFFPEVMVIKCQKWIIFCIFYCCQQKISHSSEKIFTCIWKILLSSFRKFYGLLDSELPLARYKPLNIQSFITFLLTQQFFDISTLDISQTVTPRPINHAIFWKNSKRSFRCT